MKANALVGWAIWLALFSLPATGCGFTGFIGDPADASLPVDDATVRAADSGGSQPPATEDDAERADAAALDMAGLDASLGDAGSMQEPVADTHATGEVADASVPTVASAADDTQDGTTAPVKPAEPTWPGKTGKSGVNGSPTIDRASVEAFCKWRGRDCPIAQSYTERSSWDKMTRDSGWLFDNFADFPGQLVVSQGLVPDGHPQDLAACANGDHDRDFRDFGSLMVAKGRAGSIVRLGWEFNGHFMAWSATDAEQWKTCYRHAAAAIRAADPSVILDWTINAHGTPSDVCAGLSTNCYPGDEWVDIIGIDNYDLGPSATSEADFNRIAQAQGGLTWIYEFAKAHGKKVSVGEWGVAPGSPYNQMGENPPFIRFMHDWFVQHESDLAYEMYFNDCGTVESNLYLPVSARCSRRNATAAADYRRLFGSGS